MESKRLPSKHSDNNREKRVKRKEILEKKKAIDECIKSASADKDPLASFLPFSSYNRNGLFVHLKAECGDKLSLPIKQYIMSLLKDNMEEPYGSDWPTEEKVKRREMVVPEARYIFVHETPNECSYRTERERTYMNCIEDKGHMVGFVHYRFTLEEEIPVLYVYELQLEPCVQAKGLGKFLMQLLELVAHKNRMGAVMLTVQKANSLAMNFYLNKLRYVISAVSPSRVDPLELRRVMKFFVKHLTMKPKLSLRSVTLLRSKACNKSWLINEPTTMYQQQINIVILKSRQRNDLNDFGSSNYGLLMVALQFNVGLVIHLGCWTSLDEEVFHLTTYCCK